jgi:predicted metal-dependent peptidase
VKIRPLSGTEGDAFRLARLVAAERGPYFMTALFAARPVAAEGLGTFAVDREWRLYLDPALLVGPQAWAIEACAGVLLHEVGHLIRDHAGRAETLPAPRSLLAWNLAGDCEINDDLLAAGVMLPGEAVTPAALGMPDSQFAEWYYAALNPDEPDTAERESLDDGGPGCGSGAGSEAVPGELAETGDSIGAAPVSDAEADLLRRRIARDVLDHVPGAGRGTAPAGLARWASQVLAPPTIPWTRVLRAAVRRAVADRAGRVDYSYARPSRRRVPGIVKPSLRSPVVRVSVVVDTSGSMGQGDLDAALGEVAGVLRASGIDRDAVTLVSCDAAAASAVRVRSLSTIRLSGGGGTDMRVGISAAEGLRPRPDIVVVLTDGLTPWPQHPSRALLVCGIITAAETPPPTPPWACTVLIPPSVPA